MEVPELLIYNIFLHGGKNKVVLWLNKYHAKGEGRCNCMRFDCQCETSGERSAAEPTKSLGHRVEGLQDSSAYASEEKICTSARN